MARSKKVNTRLKQLAETRARASANAERYTLTMNNLSSQIETAKAALENLIGQQLNLEQSLNHVYNLIRQTDKSIKDEFPGVEPNQIPSTYGFRSEYGRRGMLSETILEVLREAGRDGLVLKELGTLVSGKFGIVHYTPEDFRRWVANSIEPALKRMRKNKSQVQSVRLPGSRPRWVLTSFEHCWNTLDALGSSKVG